MPGIGNVAHLKSEATYRKIESALDTLQEWLEANTLAEAKADLTALAKNLRQLWPALRAADAAETLWKWRIAPGVGGWAAGRWDAQVMRSAQYHDNIESAKGPPDPNWTAEQLRERQTPEQMIDAHAFQLEILLRGAGAIVEEGEWIDFRSAFAEYAKELLNALRLNERVDASTPMGNAPPAQTTESSVPPWLTALRDSMKPTFEAGSVECTGLKLIVADLEHAWLVSYCFDPQNGFHPSVEAREHIAMTGISGWPQGAAVHLFGKQAYINRFRRAAYDAGALLPKEDDPGRTPEYFVAAWIAFVVNQLKTHPSNVIAVDDGSPQSPGDELHVNPFTASLTAISSAIGSATAERSVPPKPDALFRFARLPDGRYQVRFGEEADTLWGLEGLRLVEYLLKQPGKYARVMDINKALYAEASGEVAGEYAEACGEVEVEREALAMPKEKHPRSRRQKDDDEQKEVDDENITLALQNIAQEREYLSQARGLQDGVLIKKHEIELERWTRALAVLQRPEEFAEAEAASERVRKKLSKNFKNMIDALKKARLGGVAAHFETAVDYKEYRWRYQPPSPIPWIFEPESPAK